MSSETAMLDNHDLIKSLRSLLTASQNKSRVWVELRFRSVILNSRDKTRDVAGALNPWKKSTPESLVDFLQGLLSEQSSQIQGGKGHWIRC